MSKLKTRLRYDWTVVNDWLIQRSNRYYTFRQKQEYRSSQRTLERKS